ncbi:hypothetical protein ES703_48744 [subsurface metagenome]
MFRKTNHIYFQAHDILDQFQGEISILLELYPNIFPNRERRIEGAGLKKHTPLPPQHGCIGTGNRQKVLTKNSDLSGLGTLQHDHLFH